MGSQILNAFSNSQITDVNLNHISIFNTRQIHYRPHAGPPQVAER